HARVVADVQHARPSPAAVGRLVQPAIVPRPPQRPLRRHVHDVRIPRIDHDLPDMFRVLQAQVLPRRPAIPAAINPIPKRHAPRLVFPPPPPPPHGRVFRTVRDPPNRTRPLLIKYRPPGPPRFFVLPAPAAPHGDVPLPHIARIHRDIDNASRHQRRPDR